jgi:HEAT repeat protein
VPAATAKSEAKNEAKSEGGKGKLRFGDVDMTLAKGKDANPPWIGVFDQDAKVRRATIVQLFDEGDYQTIVNLYLQLPESADRAKIEFLRMAAQHGNEPALPMFVAALEDKDDAIRSHGAVSLEIGRLGGGVDGLLKAMRKERDDQVANDMIRALGACAYENGDALDMLLRKSRDRLTEARVHAFGAMHHLKDNPRTLDTLRRRGLEDREDQVRYITTWVLGYLRDKESRPLLVKERKKTRRNWEQLVFDEAINMIDGKEMSDAYLKAYQDLLKDPISREPAQMPKWPEK